MVAGGIAIGLAVGWLFGHLRAIATDPSIDVALSVLTPFVAYVPAEKLHASGVLATVVAGLYIGARSLDIIEPGTRLRTLAFWDSAAFLLDGLLFVLIGLQVPSIIERIPNSDLLELGADALLIAVVVMGVRALWMLIVPTLLHADTTREERIAIAWSGMRGGVSLAAALAITGHGFPKRELVIFVAYGVIVLTLVVPGPDARTAAAAARPERVRGRSPARRRGAPAHHPGGARAPRGPRATRRSTSSSACAIATARASSAGGAHRGR